MNEMRFLSRVLIHIGFLCVLGACKSSGESGFIAPGFGDPNNTSNMTANPPPPPPPPGSPPPSPPPPPQRPAVPPLYETDPSPTVIQFSGGGGA